MFLVVQVLVAVGLQVFGEVFVGALVGQEVVAQVGHRALEKMEEVVVLILLV